ncbi:YcnI family protein [Nocardioides sp. DS6]|uniref:YcnI family protein n=1 Tax=Nocardioides eburneus TaxID=3231482 RepID=A0ABV3T165_9ACTN
MNSNRIARLVPAAALAAGAVLLAAGPASAHVTVNPNEVPGGGYSKLTFRVPTESDTASTTKLQVYFPADSGLQSVSVKPHPGWSAKVAKKGDTVTRITWTPDAKADAIKPGEFDEFDVSVGPLPKTGTLTFKALQTYSDGSVVRWIEVPKSGQAEPEHPAPVLTVVPSDQATPTAGGTATSADSEDADAAKADDDGGSTTGPWILSIIAVVLGGGALANSFRKRA